MPVAVGNNAVSKIYLGSKEVTKAYLGGTEIFSNAASATPSFSFTISTWLDRPSDIQGPNPGVFPNPPILGRIPRPAWYDGGHFVPSFGGSTFEEGYQIVGIWVNINTVQLLWTTGRRTSDGFVFYNTFGGSSPITAGKKIVLKVSNASDTVLATLENLTNFVGSFTYSHNIVPSLLAAIRTGGAFTFTFSLEDA